MAVILNFKRQRSLEKVMEWCWGFHRKRWNLGTEQRKRSFFSSCVLFPPQPKNLDQNQGLLPLEMSGVPVLIYTVLLLTSVFTEQICPFCSGVVFWTFTLAVTHITPEKLIQKKSENIFTHSNSPNLFIPGGKIIN